MNKLVLLLLLPFSAVAFSVTNLPGFGFVESVQPMDGANLNFVVASVPSPTNTVAVFRVTFNSEPLQLPRMCFLMDGAGVYTIVDPFASTFPTNSATDGYWSYLFYCDKPVFPENARMLCRRQGYFGGPPESGRGLDCAGFAFYDPLAGAVWVSVTNDVFRLWDANSNSVLQTVKNGLFVRRPVMSLMVEPVGGGEL